MRIALLKAHTLHILSNFIIIHPMPFDENLLYDNPETTLHIASKSEYSERCPKRVALCSDMRSIANIGSMK